MFTIWGGGFSNRERGLIKWNAIHCNVLWCNITDMMYCTGRTVLYLQICDLCVCVAVPTRILIPSNYHYIPYIPYIPYSMVYIYIYIEVYQCIISYPMRQLVRHLISHLLACPTSQHLRWHYLFNHKGEITKLAPTSHLNSLKHHDDHHHHHHWTNV